MRTAILSATLSLLLTAGASFAWAQPATPAPAPVNPPAVASNPPAKQPDSLVLYSENGKATLRPQDEALLDDAPRLYRDGQPIVMLVSRATDAVGSATQNLELSALRANAVVHGLVARSIPAERLQLLAKGESQPAVQANAADLRNRRVEITWR